MAAKVMSGARAKLGFYDGQKPTYVGIFADVSYGVTYDVQPAFILGSYNAVELDYTAMEVVHVTCTGFRVVNKGWFADAKFPALNDLMFAEYLTMDVLDRQTNLTVARIDYVRPASATGGFTAKMLSTSTHTYMGLLVSDESKPDNRDSHDPSFI
jgi:hypothetical protein